MLNYYSYHGVNFDDIDAQYIKNKYMKRLSKIAQNCECIDFEKLINVETAYKILRDDYIKKNFPNYAYEEYTKYLLCKKNVILSYQNRCENILRCSDIFVGFYLPKNATRSVSFIFEIGGYSIEKIKLIPGEFRYAVGGNLILPIDACYHTELRIYSQDCDYDHTMICNIMLIYSQDQHYIFHTSSHPTKYSAPCHYNFIMGDANSTFGFDNYNFLVIMRGYAGHYNQHANNILKAMDVNKMGILNLSNMKKLKNIKNIKNILVIINLNFVLTLIILRKCMYIYLIIRFCRKFIIKLFCCIAN